LVALGTRCERLFGLVRKPNFSRVAKQSLEMRSMPIPTPRKLAQQTPSFN
jgi:hypothetical protein